MRSNLHESEKFQADMESAEEEVETPIVYLDNGAILSGPQSIESLLLAHGEDLHVSPGDEPNVGPAS